MGDTKSFNADAIRTMGNEIGDLKNDITPVISQLNGLTVTPGDFADANDLKTTVEARRDSTINFLNSVITKLDDTKQKLNTAADNGKDTENSNTNSAGSA